MGRFRIGAVVTLLSSTLLMPTTSGGASPWTLPSTPGPARRQAAKGGIRPLPGPQGLSGLFEDDLPLSITLEADFEQLKKDRDPESPERSGTLRVAMPDGAFTDIPVMVRTRGNFRLQRRTCQDPPLRLEFPDTMPPGTPFDGQDKLKLVTHCRDSDRYEQNLLEEYLTYRIYNQLTDMSFRVRLAEVTYVDTSGKNKPVERMGFFIEDEDALAERLGGVPIQTPSSNPTDFVLEQLSLMYMFQYLVGNIDWGTGASHNIKILLKDRRYYPIAYDFDWTGLVDAPYAGPNEQTQHQHRSVRERVYRGVCLPGIDYEKLFSFFRSKKEEILGLANEQAGLSEGNRRSAVRYLEEFYEIIDNPRSVGRYIIDQCRVMG